MSNNSVFIANLCADPTTVQLGEKEGVKLRLADNTGQRNATRFFGALFTGKDAEKAARLRKGDRIVVTGQLVVTSYKAKKDDKKRNIKAGQEMLSDEMPYAHLAEVIKSPSFYAADDAPPDAPADDDADDSDDPLGDL